MCVCVPDYTLARILTPLKMIEQQNPSVFVTSPSNMYQPFPQQQQQQQPFYDPQGNCFLDAVNTPLPPSPLSSSSFASENFC